MNYYYGVDPVQKRQKLMQSDAAKGIIDEIIRSADEAMNEESPSFKMSEYMLFQKNGDRKIFEKSYFDRRRKCNNIMLAYWLTEDEKYLEPLMDYISYICDEFTWCLPAHCQMEKGFLHGVVEQVDLFQAETARFFAEIVMCVGDKLPEYILSRMEYEVRRRIFKSFERFEAKEPGAEASYAWETCKMNWATVCGAGCTMAALCFGTEAEAEKYVNRFIGCLDSYLDGIGEDGCCTEGMSYWSYGFSHFVILAMAVRIYSNGEIDYFKKPKVKQLALFPQRIRMSGSKVASISDGDEKFCFKIGHLSLLKTLYGDVLLPELLYGTRHGNVDSVCELLWFDENYQSDLIPYETYYFADSQWYVSRKKNFSIVAKGGCNNEPHNHNDIGSFMITVGEETLISDLGAGEYVKDTFQLKTRYTYLQNSSRGHSVPIVNGKYQQQGDSFCANNIKVGANFFELNIEGAYTPGIIKEIKRHFTIDENKIILRDTFQFSSETVSVTERFISKIKPQLCDGCVDFGIGRIAYDKDSFMVSVGTDTYVAHNGIDIVTVYLIDFLSVSKEQKEFEVTFFFTDKNQ